MGRTQCLRKDHVAILIALRNSRALMIRQTLTFVSFVLFLSTSPMFGSPNVVNAAKTTYSESEVKAAYLYKFSGFVDWPDTVFSSDKAPFLIGVLGDDPFQSILDKTIEGKKAKDHPVAAKRSNIPSDLKECHIVFISASEKNRIESIIAEFATEPVLTVSDSEDFVKQGGVIGLVNIDDKIRFEVNLDAAKKAGLKISSQLLDVARVILSDGKEKQNS